MFTPNIYDRDDVRKINLKMSRKKLIICGGGIIGITIAREAALTKKFSQITVLEKDNVLGSHSSTRNSGVIHAGFYYSPETIKAKFCSKGNKLMREYCLKNNISIKKCGKVVVTKNQKEEEILSELYERGKINGCHLKLFNKEKLEKFENYALTYKNFLWSPNTWSISPPELLRCLIDECKLLNINFITGDRVISADSNYIETYNNKKLYFDYLINACGYSIEVSKIFGVNTNYKLLLLKDFI